MKVTLRSPDSQALGRLLGDLQDADFSYREVGESAGSLPPGYDHDDNRVLLGTGGEVFASAQAALREWAIFPPDWTRIYPKPAPIRQGQVVLVGFRLFRLWWINPCRIVYLVDEKDRFGFAYGTLSGHVETGEERFIIESDEGGQVWYRIRAFSRPSLNFVRLGYPLARYHQKRFVQQSLGLMLRAVQQSQE